MSLPATLEASELGTLRELARGGIGAVSTFSENFGDPARRLVAKLFDRPERVAHRALYLMVGWRRGLSDAERRRLDRATAWPLSVITRAGAPVGFVMDRVPARFEEELRLPSGTYRSVLREAQYLFCAPERSHRLGLRDASARTRAEVIWNLAETIGFLHTRGVTIGDLSTRNVLWSPSPGGVLLVDCDSMILEGVGSPHPYVSTVDWDDPQVSNEATTASDVYKVALFVLRALGRSFQSRDPALADPGLDPAGQALLRMSLSGEPSRRPEAHAWERWAVGRRAAASAGAR